MSGVLEQLIDALNRNTAALQAAGGQSIVQQQPVVQPQQQAVVQPQQQAVTVTEAQLTGLIQPHIGNEAIKGALGNAMRSMGINSLPDAQAHQYGQLYQAFQGVLAQFGIGGAAPQAQQTAVSII